VTPDTRDRAPFELLRFIAAPVSADVSVVELEGRFAQQARFARQPLLVVEEGEGPRIELSPVRAVRDGERWSATFAIPLSALDGATFALGVRGTLLDLPPPDVADDGDRLAGVAREANALRRRLEAAEDEVAAARAEAAAAASELATAVPAAAEAARAEATDRILALERELVVVHRQSAQDVEEARAEVAGSQQEAFAAALARAEAAEQRAEAAEAAADARAMADERADEPDARADAAAAGVEVLRAELAEERERAQTTIADLRAQLDESRAGLGDDPTALVEPDADPATHVLSSVDDAPAPRKNPRPPGAPPPTREPLHRPAGPAPSRWVAVGALALFLFALLGLLLGFLP